MNNKIRLEVGKFVAISNGKIIEVMTEDKDVAESMAIEYFKTDNVHVARIPGIIGYIS